MESGGWFNESVMSFLGCLIFGLLPPSLGVIDEEPIADSYNRSTM
jgi:hypothetical protein